MLKLVEDNDDLPTNDNCFACQIRELLKMEYRKVKAPRNFAEALAEQKAKKRIQKAIREGTKDIENLEKYWKIS